MKNPNQLDDLVRRKLAQRHHPPPPGAWQAAQQLLDAEQATPQRRRRGWGWLLLSLILLAGTLWAWSPWRSHLPESMTAQADASTQAGLQGSGTAFPVIETEKCPPQPAPPANLASSSTPDQKSQTAFANANRTTQPQVSYQDSATNPAAHPTEEAKGGPPRVSGEPRPEGSEYADLAAVYALARQHITLPHRDLATLAEADPTLVPETDARRYALQVEAGLALSQSWQNTQLAKAAVVSSPVLGLGLSRELRPGLRIQLGLRYQQRAGLNSDSTYRRELRSFGRNDTLVQIDPRRLHFVGVPLRLDWRLLGRHYLQIGAQANWLLETSSRVNTTVVDDQGASPLPEERSGGYRQGFAPWDVQLLLGYRYYLGRGLRIGLSGSYGLRDLTDPTFFNNDRINRAWNLRLMLEYDLARF